MADLPITGVRVYTKDTPDGRGVYVEPANQPNTGTGVASILFTPDTLHAFDITILFPKVS